jgi:hypothetical protein
MAAKKDKREKMSRLEDVIPKARRNDRAEKTFKDYEPGLIHLDMKYPP